MKKLNFFRFLNFWLYVFFSIGVPIILIAEKYALVVQTSPYRVTGMGIIVSIILLFYFKGQFKEMIESMDESNTKTLCKESLRVAPILIAYFMLMFAEVQMQNFQFIVLWSFVSNIIAVFFRVNHLRYLNIIKGMRK